MNNEIIKRVKNEDPKAYEELLESYGAMINSIVSVHNLECGDYLIEREDLFQEGVIALYEAAKLFDENSGVKFSTFAYTVIKRAVNRSFYKTMGQYKEEICSYSKYEDADRFLCGNAMYVCDSGVSYFDNLELMDKLNKSYDFLSEIEKNIINLRLHDYSYKEIAEILNITTKKIDNTLSRARKKINTKLYS